MHAQLSAACGQRSQSNLFFSPVYYILLIITIGTRIVHTINFLNWSCFALFWIAIDVRYEFLCVCDGTDFLRNEHKLYGHTSKSMMWHVMAYINHSKHIFDIWNVYGRHVAISLLIFNRIRRFNKIFTFYNLVEITFWSYKYYW